MRRRRRFPYPTVVPYALVVLAAFTACAHRQAASTLAPDVVPITSVKAVSGTWEGLASRDAGGKSDWLELTLREDGTFTGFSARQIGAFVGAGTVHMRNGTLVAVGPRGSAVMTLSDRGGPLLTVDFTERDGVTYSADLRPKTPRAVGGPARSEERRQ